MAGRRWLLKTEPSDYSFDDLSREKRAVWDGVANNLALMNLRLARKGDEVIVYHTGKEKAAVGLAAIESDPYPDPKKKDAKLVVVDIAPRRKLPKPVPLATIKANAKFREFPLVKIPRLSFLPVSDKEWKEILRLAGSPPPG